MSSTNQRYTLQIGAFGLTFHLPAPATASCWRLTPLVCPRLPQVLQPRLREIIVAVLRLPQRVSPLPEPLQTALRAPTTQRNRSPFQHLGVSAVPAPHRVPSPLEIQVHTQQILQQALIKRKLEEQKENFRKRQENRCVAGVVSGRGGNGGGGIRSDSMIDGARLRIDHYAGFLEAACCIYFERHLALYLRRKYWFAKHIQFLYSCIL